MQSERERVIAELLATVEWSLKPNTLGHGHAKSVAQHAYDAGHKAGIEAAAKVVDSFKCSELESAKNVRPLIEAIRLSLRSLAEGEKP